VGANTGLVRGVSPGSIQIMAEFPSLVEYAGNLCSYGGLTPCPVGSPGGSSPGSVPCPVPTDFTGSGVAMANGDLEFTYYWGSTSGSVDDLSQCGCTENEYVTYPGSGASYTWPDPPWYQATINPTIVPPAGQPATVGGTVDIQHTGVFLSPTNGPGTPFSATQYFQYVCTGVNNGKPVSFGGPFTITRSVSQSGGTLTYTITKSGVSASCQVGVNCENAAVAGQ
jgi:hypothetical protein